MKLTEEQKNIIETDSNIKINAVAGSGKTTTLIEYAKSKSGVKKILYLAFNSSVKLSAREKFANEGLTNIRVETAHSLAYNRIVRGTTFSLTNYTTDQIAKILDIQTAGKDKSSVLIAANHIKKYANYYCNSNKEKVQDLDYLATVKDASAQNFVLNNLEGIVYATRLLLAKMNRAEIGITHDFYLKLFQLRKPQLNYDYILFDEGQDASQAMLDVFLNQNSKKVIVGDTNQQIYAWRYAINSLQQVRDFPEFPLSASFRLDNELAEFAKEILKWKSHFKNANIIDIKGKGGKDTIKTRATIARTNLKLLIKAIDMVTGYGGEIKKIYFEGNLNSYTYATAGASLYDILNLYEGKNYLIKDELIKSIGSFYDLKDYAEKSEEADLSIMIDIVEEYGKELPKLIKLLKEKHVSNEERNKADMIFSTVHRCKGLEYDEVTLVNDFINEDSILKLVKKDDSENVDFDSIEEEINLLYVASTRALSKLKVPEELTNAFSKNLIFNSKKHVLISSATGHNYDKYKVDLNKNLIQKKFKLRTEDWTPEMDFELEEKLIQKVPLGIIAKYFCTSKSAILKRINELDISELLDFY